MKKPRIAIITNILTTYRKGFYDRLFHRDDLHVEVFCQDSMPGMNLLSIHQDYPHNINIIKYISAKKGKIAWQFIPWRKLIKSFDVIFVAGNPRVLSDAVFGTFCRLINKKIVFWTMAHSFRGNKTTESIRLFWSKIFPIIFVYTDKEVIFLRKKGFIKHHIIGMNNGLDQNKIDQAIQNAESIDLIKWKSERGLNNKVLIISSARLEKKNQFNLVLDALPEIIKKIPDIHWVLIGGGEEYSNLKIKAKEMGIENYVSFLGAMYDETKLAPYFMSSSLFVHPSAIGLSLLHAFGYGLPVIVHGQEELHNPEYAAFKNHETGLNFMKDNPNDLSQKIITLLKNPEKAAKMGENARFLVRNVYNVDTMVERFVNIVNYALKL